MPNKLRDILAPRPGVSQEEQRQALLRYVVLTLVIPGTVTSIYYMVTWVMTGDGYALELMSRSLAAHPFMLWCYWLVRRGELDLAYYVPPAFMWLAATGMLWLFGPNIYLMLFFVGATVIAGLLLGMTHSLITAMLSVISYAAIGWFANQRTPVPISTSTLMAQVVAVALGGAIMVIVLTVIDRRTVQRLRSKNLALEQQVSQQMTVLQLSEQRMRAIFQGMPVPTFAWRRIGEDFVLVDHNEAAEIQTRGGVTHYLGVQASKHYADRPDIVADLNTCYESQSQFRREIRYEFQRSPGSCELYATFAFVAPDTVLVLTEDITEARQAQAALRDSERRMRNLWSSIPGMSYRCLNDEHWTMTFVSEGCYSLTGYTPDELLNNPQVGFANMLYAEDLKRIQNSPGSARSREDEFDVTYRIRTAQGETKWVWDQGIYVKDETGQEIAQEGLILDISKTHTAQASLLASESRNRQLVEAYPDAILVTDSSVNILAANQAALAMFGTDSEATLIGTSFFDLVAPKDRPRARYNAFHGVAAAPNQHIDYDMLRDDGTIFPIEMCACVVRNFEGRSEVFIVFARDITNRRHLQQQLQAALKLEAVGRLAGGIAHDFNNLLTVINGYASFLADSLGDGDARHDDAIEILRAGQRAAHLTKQLLAFSRRQVMQAETMNLNDIVRDIEPMLISLIGEKISFECDLAQDLPNARLDRAQIERAITNLVTNARDAMPDGGNMRIYSQAVTLSKTLEAIPDSIAPGDYVLLSVTDNGVGMTPSVRERALEPFYTTKGVGEGTGLGLSMVYGTIRQLGGALRIKSEPGLGTSVMLYVPRSSETVDATDTSRPSDSLLKGSETILLVEDEQIVREYVARALSQMGYRIVAAHDGDDAIALCKEQAHAFDMLLSDIVMPGMNGPELAESLEGICHIPHRLFMSGHSHEVMQQMGSDVPEVEMIRKPFSPFDLAQRIRHMLDQ